MRKSIRVTAGAVGIVAAIATGGTALALAVSADSATSRSDGAACGGVAPKLTVQGTGMASGTPNVLTVSVGIDVTDPSAQASLADDDSKASAVTAALKRGGVLEKDVQTTNLQIQPQYNSRGTVTGYEVTNTLTAELRDFSSAGSVIDALAEAAGNAVRINSLSFSIEDSRGIENQARTDAVHQAVSHARSMARAAGQRLGPVCSLTDNSSVSDASPDDFGPLSAAASPVPVEPGTQQASAQVTMVYSLE
jgi:uncharacterized protein YggE